MNHTTNTTPTATANPTHCPHFLSRKTNTTPHPNHSITNPTTNPTHTPATNPDIHTTTLLISVHVSRETCLRWRQPMTWSELQQSPHGDGRRRRRTAQRRHVEPGGEAKTLQPTATHTTILPHTPPHINQPKDDTPPRPHSNRTTRRLSGPSQSPVQSARQPASPRTDCASRTRIATTMHTPSSESWRVQRTRPGPNAISTTPPPPTGH